MSKNLTDTQLITILEGFKPRDCGVHSKQLENIENTLCKVVESQKETNDKIDKTNERIVNTEKDVLILKTERKTTFAVVASIISLIGVIGGYLKGLV